MLVDVTRGSLCVGVERYPLRVPFEDGLFVRQVTTEMALALLPPVEEILMSQRNLGLWAAYNATVDRLLLGAGAVRASASAASADAASEGNSGIATECGERGQGQGQEGETEDKGEMVCIRKGRFGFYVQCGKVRTSVRRPSSPLPVS